MRIWLPFFVTIAVACDPGDGPSSATAVERAPFKVTVHPGFDDCGSNDCLHNCKTYPQDVRAEGGRISPRAILYCESNAQSPVEPCWQCGRTIALRLERRPRGRPIDEAGEVGTGKTARYTDAGAWSAVGPILPKLTGYCYRTASRIELSNGYKAGWKRGPFTCF